MHVDSKFYNYTGEEGLLSKDTTSHYLRLHKEFMWMMLSFSISQVWLLQNSVKLQNKDIRNHVILAGVTSNGILRGFHKGIYRQKLNAIL